MLNVSFIKVLFGLWNRPLEWNDHSYEIVITLFGRDLFLGIVIPILLRRRIHIPVKNEE
jgi:hypothetical protein